MMAESMLSVLPRPITSARMPPVEYDGILEDELSLTSVRGASWFQGNRDKHLRYVDDISQSFLHALRDLPILSVADELQCGPLVS